MSDALVIVGASYAGVQLAATARELGFGERIVLLGDERHLPYQRPPLSKGLLIGQTTPGQLALRGAAFYDENRIDLRLGRRVVAVDPQGRSVTLDDGRRLDYGWLALATGARCRPLPVPGAALKNVLPLRTLDDALAVRDAAAGGRRACVIGGGFIGLEVASALRSAGADVTVIEAQSRLLGRSVGPLMSAFVADAHVRRGVTLHAGHAVRALHGTSGRVESAELDDGRRIDCDLVVLGVGVLPNTDLARRAGAEIDDGILVDASGRTTVSRILAAGDVARMRLPGIAGDAGSVRLESVQAANDGARAAAAVVVGQERPCAAVPWFWSDQFDLKFQMAGLCRPGDECLVRGDMAGERFSVFHLRAGRVAAVQSVNRPAEHMQARKLIAAGASPTAAQLEDPGFDLRLA